ncbi:fatty acid desaturase [Alteromonadaceae bacterium M269]|nr:fatty acid desaturase [Alteromonadaceae bacterium M269]
MNNGVRLDPKAVRTFGEKSNLKGGWILLFNWLLIAFAFALPIISLNAVTVIVSLVILANRQLGLAILMHECSHYSLFKTHKLNQVLGQIFCGAPVLADLDGYRTYHLRHHSEAGTTTDPDYPNYKNYPVTNKSWTRKVIRDFAGITGLKTLYAILLMNAGVLKYDMSYQSSSADKKLSAFQVFVNLLRNLALPFIVHLAIWGALAFLGHGWLYALWWISYFTVYMFIIRVRNAAEHGNVPDLLDKNPLLHARTTYASWWERLTFAPNYVNYHLEHHLRPNIPCYNLKAFHQYLLDEGHLKEVRVATGYIDVMRQLRAV